MFIHTIRELVYDIVYFTLSHKQQKTVLLYLIDIYALPIKCFISHCPTDTSLLKSIKSPDSPVKEASTLIYQHIIVLLITVGMIFMSLSLINIDTAIVDNEKQMKRPRF